MKQKRRNSWPLITGGRKRSTWTSKRQSFHSSVPLILPAQFSLHPTNFNKTYPLSFLSLPIVLSKLHNFSKLFRKNFQHISKSNTSATPKDTKHFSLSLSLSLKRARGYTLGGFLNEHPIWKLVRREFVTALILNHRVFVGKLAPCTFQRTEEQRESEREREHEG